MKQLYFEPRALPNSPSATLAADIAKHLQSRQYLGSALIVCDNPGAVLSSVRKQWLKAARKLLKLRASTLNAEEILRLTHVIMHMQTLQFVARSPLDSPDASIYVASPAEALPLPDNCYTVYFISPPTPETIPALFKKLPENGLIVSYIGAVHGLVLPPKTELEQRIYTQWQALVAFLQHHGIMPDDLVVGNALQFVPMDKALDILLGVADSFLRQAADFQRAINVAQPLTQFAPELHKKFEAVTRLAYRVQALTPGNFNHYLVHTFDDSGADPFFLRDAGSELYEDLEHAAATGQPSAA
ncbi:MAG TPA: hypothetical protein VLA88_01960 [Candidatus Saccharimonadales bacterium]|nr:hypothetical protein [Candidatus Saccharimonadales bacterium]